MAHAEAPPMAQAQPSFYTVADWQWGRPSAAAAPAHLPGGAARRLAPAASNVGRDSWAFFSRIRSSRASKSRMAGARPTELTGSTTTIDSLPNELLAEVLIRVPTPAALVHAAAASRRWYGIAATGNFLGDYRALHSSSPFLGLYVPRELGGLPLFQMADSIRSVDADVDRDLQCAAASAFSLRGLESHPNWGLLDCHNGRLLLTRGDESSLVVYSPLSGERISVSLPRDDVHPDFSASACLLRGHGDAASFRVFFVQHGRRGQTVRARAIEYDSNKNTWQYYPWETLSAIDGTVQGEVTLMHAGDLIFCKSRDPSLFMLDTSKMKFCAIPLPGDKNPKYYSIGEMEDGVCCLASVEPVGISKEWRLRLRVWTLEQLNWKLEREMEVMQVVGNHTRYPYYRIRAVTNGIALLCSNNCSLHFIVDLKTFSIKETFEFKGMVAYPMHMPWPPAFSVATVTAETQSDEVVEECSTSPSKGTAGQEK